MISSTILFVDELPFLQKFPPHNFEHFFVVTISITSQQNVFEEKKVIEQFQLFIFGTEVLISLISSLGVGGILGKRNQEPHTGFFLFQIKKKEPPS